MTLWLYIHFPSLQLDSLIAHSEVDNTRVQPTIIVHGNRNEVYQCCHIANQQGIKCGMGLATAAALANDLSVQPYNRELECQKLKEIADWLYTITSDICLFEPDGLLLRVSNMLTLYSDLNSYWQSIKQQLTPFKLRYHYATGYSPLAARLLARNGYELISDKKEKLSALLNQQAIKVTELTSTSIEKLTRVGIVQLYDLLAIPIADIAKRFDLELVNYVGRLTSQLKYPVSFYHPPEHFNRELTLLFDLEKIAWLQKPLARLFLELEHFLKLKDKLAYEVAITLVLRDENQYQCVVTAANGEYQANKWLALCQLTLESAALTAPITAVHLTASRMSARSADDRDLLESKRGNSCASELISLLQAKLGQIAVRGLKLNDDPRPNISSQTCEPFSAEAMANAFVPKNSQYNRPSLLLTLPQPLTEPVNVRQGPERIATGWWDNHPICRDYFIAQDHFGRWLWVYKDQQQRWYLHGYFS